MHEISRRIRSPILRQHGGLISLAAIAVCIVVVRACLQSITIDEAGTLVSFARLAWPSQWWPSSNNHVLNSLLMRLAITIFGVSDLTVRLPAILGALIYISSAFYLCVVLIRNAFLRLLLFICLVYNPMILDYLVAARGYSLAIGLLLAAIGVMASVMLAADIDEQATLLRKCACVSVLLALSSAANFSFAIVDGTALIAWLWWTLRRARFGSRDSLRLAMCTCLPGLLVGFILCGSVILNWHKGELYFGSKQLSEMWSGFAAGTFDNLDPQIVNPLLLRWLAPIKHWAWIIALAGVFLVIHMEISRWRRPDPKTHALGDFVRGVLAVSAVTLLLHWLVFKLLHIPLPKDRTGLFFIPLWTLAFVGSLAIGFRTGKRSLTSWGGVAILSIAAFYFIGCLRVGYFKEWRFDSDTKTLYWIMYDLNRRCGIEKFGIDWRYHVPLNFYRDVYANQSLDEFSESRSDDLPKDRDAYAIYFPTSEDFIRQQKLRVIYHNDVSDAAVAIRGCPAEQNQAAIPK
jgi:hypothetical protein